MSEPLGRLQHALVDWLCDEMGMTNYEASLSATVVDMAILAAYRHPEWAQAYAMSLLPDASMERLAEKLVQGVPIR